MITNKTNLLFTLLLLFIADIQFAYAQEPIVYSRCARTTDTIQISAQVNVDGIPQQASRLMKGLDIYDVLPDVTNFFTGFSAPCDLMYKDSQGTERILYNCSDTSTDENACAALDPAVSFDGKTIAFSVFKGSLYQHNLRVQHQVINENASSDYTDRINLPNKKLKTTGAHLHTIDVATGKLSFKPFELEIYDSGPAFLANGRLAFTSNRDRHTSTVVWRSTGSREGTRIWSIDLNWKNLELASHHSLSQEQHPYLLKNGRLAYSSWQILGSQAFRHTNGSIGGFTTLDNMFHIYSQFPDGADNFPIYGQHSGGHSPSYFGENHTAAHFITQTSDERIWFSDYYRGNNNGFGALIGVMQEPDGQEGKSPKNVQDDADIFVPNNIINFATWANNVDGASLTLPPPSIKHPGYTDNLIFAGKVGHPAALPKNKLMLSWGKGACSTVATSRILTDLGIPIPIKVNGSGGGVAMNMMTHINRDIPACDSGVYIASTIPSQHPSDLQLVVDSPNWHEIMARAVVPYKKIHGTTAPANIPVSSAKITHPLLEKGTPFGLLGAASITDRETHPKEGIKFAGEKQFNLQGTDTINYQDEDLCGIRILSVMPNRSQNTVRGISNLFGERVGILGEFPVIHKDQENNIIFDSSGHPDTSFLVRFPANAPYLMQGIDCQGRTLNTDMTWQHLRPGERKVCGGCHVHSRPSRISFEQSFAATADYEVPRLGEGLVPLLTGKIEQKITTREVPGYSISIDFHRDIMPIFAKHCTSCHGGNSPAAELSLDRSGDHNNRDQLPSTWWCLVGDYTQECLSQANQFNTNEGSANTAFRRPQVTKYIRAFNSLGSLLYWKAANQRTDRNSDSTYSDDIDFGFSHPTNITSLELGILSRWIDLGSPGGSEELLDTQKPTLNVIPVVDNESISALNIGTTDIGSGIDPMSLVVCILDQNDECHNLATKAEESGVTQIELGEILTDVTTKIFVSVKDVSGNVTEVQRTVGFLTTGNTSNITITPINDVELIDDETYSFYIDVIDNRVNTPNTIDILTTAGTIEKNDESHFTLVPPVNFHGEIFLTVTVTDNQNIADTNNISFNVNVTQTNKSPVSLSASITTPFNTPSNETLVTVIDPDNNDTHTITLISQPINGEVTITNNALIYTPKTGFSGTDNFIIKATDQGGLSIDGTVEVMVEAESTTAPPDNVTTPNGGNNGGTTSFTILLFLSLFIIHQKLINNKEIS